jgi:hypothetical protein
MEILEEEFRKSQEEERKNKSKVAQQKLKQMELATKKYLLSRIFPYIS